MSTKGYAAGARAPFIPQPARLFSFHAAAAGPRELSLSMRLIKFLIAAVRNGAAPWGVPRGFVCDCEVTGRSACYDDGSRTDFSFRGGTYRSTGIFHLGFLEFDAGARTFSFLRNVYQFSDKIARGLSSQAHFKLNRKRQSSFNFSSIEVQYLQEPKLRKLQALEVFFMSTDCIL